MDRSIRCRRQTLRAKSAGLLAVSCIAWLGLLAVDDFIRALRRRQPVLEKRGLKEPSIVPWVIRRRRFVDSSQIYLVEGAILAREQENAGTTLLVDSAVTALRELLVLFREQPQRRLIGRAVEPECSFAGEFRNFASASLR